jgi:hypothetical protein
MIETRKREHSRKHFIELYRACGGPNRFSDEQVKIHSNLLFPELKWYSPNSVRYLHTTHATSEICFLRLR